MKKNNRLFTYICIICLWFTTLSVIAIGKDDAIEYAIYYDSNSSNTLEIKTFVIETYQTIMQQVNPESELTILRNNLDAFAFDETTKITFEKNQIVIKIGDGQGPHIFGNFNESSICFPKVKRKSLLAKLLDSFS